MSKDMKMLYRPEKDRIIGGVASGFAVYFGIDPTIVRIIMAAMLFAAGSGFVIYIVLWLIIPTESSVNVSSKKKVVVENSKEMEKTAHEYADKVGEMLDAPGREKWVGTFILLLGVVLLLRNFGVFTWFSLSELWPVIIIIVGLKLLIRSGDNG